MKCRGGKKGSGAGGKGVKEMRSVRESWRVVEYLHAQSLFTLHQTAADRKRSERKEEILRKTSLRVKNGVNGDEERAEEEGREMDKKSDY